MPSIIMLIFISIYGVVDGLFVSNFVGKTAFAAINLIMPVEMIFGGVGFMLGTGGSALVAKTLGEQKPELARQYFSMIMMMALIVGVILTAAGMSFVRPLAVWLGASKEMLPYCVTYGRIAMAFSTAFMFQNAFQDFMVVAERPDLGLWSTVMAGVTNMGLDALFIIVFKWGVAGAAVATGISQAVGCIIPAIFFMRNKTSALYLTKTRLRARPIGRACANGASEMVSSITSSFIGIIYNFQLLHYAGENGVASYGVLMYIQFIFAAAFIGYSMGCAPIISYHFGAENYKELKNMLHKSITLTLAVGAVLVLMAQLLAPILARIFVGYDPELLKMTIHALRISTLAFLLLGFNIFASAFFTALNNAGVSAAISILRTFVFKLASILGLPMIFAMNGIWMADVAAEISAFAISTVFLIAMGHKYHYLKGEKPWKTSKKK